MLDFPSEKHVVLLDAVIWWEHLRLFLFHVYTLVFICSCFSATAVVHSLLLLWTTCLIPFASISLCRFPSSRLFLPTSFLNITHPLAVFHTLFVLLLFTQPPIRPLSARLPLTPPWVWGKKRKSQCGNGSPVQTRCGGKNGALCKQSGKQTDHCRIQTISFNKHFRDEAASSRLFRSLKGWGGQSRGRPCANEKVGKAARGREGEWSNDTLTFEPETNESIEIKLFISLFTVKVEGWQENGKKGESNKDVPPENNGQPLRCKVPILISAKAPWCSAPLSVQSYFFRFEIHNYTADSFKAIRTRDSLGVPFKQFFLTRLNSFSFSWSDALDLF